MPSSIATWIVSRFPSHCHYVEPDGAGTAVLLEKPPARSGTLNDLDERVVNVYRVIETRALMEQLIETIGTTACAVPGGCRASG